MTSAANQSLGGLTERESRRCGWSSATMTPNQSRAALACPSTPSTNGCAMHDARWRCRAAGKPRACCSRRKAACSLPSPNR